MPPSEPRDPAPGAAAHPASAGVVILCSALAGGMGWGIRGQFGHETGAMIAGVLVAFTLALLLAPHLPLARTARAIAWGTVAIGIGGSMTYGQTIGLTQNPALIGNAEAWRWGMLGLAIKGALWIGFAGAFLGMGLGRIRYRTWELAALFGGMLALFSLGTALLNAPFDPAQRVLPRLYFSADWRWEPGAQLTPRREVWGGLLLALAGLLGWVGIARRDGLAWRLALWGVGGGAVGFPAGQCLQSYHAWHPERFIDGVWTRLDPVVNWWNMMETTFGLTLGAALGLGLWIHRRLLDATPEQAIASRPAARSSSVPAWEWALALAHAGLLLTGEFTNWPVVGAYTENGLVMAAVPILAANSGRWWPYLAALPLTLLPILVKTLREVTETPGAWHPLAAWIVLGGLPLALSLGVAIRFAMLEGGKEPASAWRYCRWGLMTTGWTYFLLNTAFFRFPWPWEPWTSRTPNALIFSVCIAGLTFAAGRSHNRHRPKAHP